MSSHTNGHTANTQAHAVRLVATAEGGALQAFSHVHFLVLTLLCPPCGRQPWALGEERFSLYHSTASWEFVSISKQLIQYGKPIQTTRRTCPYELSIYYTREADGDFRARAGHAARCLRPRGPALSEGRPDSRSAIQPFSRFAYWTFIIVDYLEAV